MQLHTLTEKLEGLRKKIFPWAFALLLLNSCSHRREEEPKLVSLQFIDRNGFNETISTPDRLDRYKQANFLEPQPYTKVVRLFQRNKEGKTASAITSYHDNGQIWQYLEVVNGRAKGLYKEWYPSGILKIEAHIVEGIGDVAVECMDSWIFDQESRIYDEQGTLLAKFAYQKGDLSGKSFYFHSNGQVRKITPYVGNEIHGEEIYYDVSGEKIGKFLYQNGKKHGKSIYHGCKTCPKFTEEYKQGLLLSGVYYNFDGRVISKIIDGNGLQTLYEEGKIKAQYEFQEGRREGKVYLYTDERLHSEYTIKSDAKHGEEWVYYDTEAKDPVPKLCLNWYHGKLQGKVKTWYPNGVLESEKEMYNNKRNGPSSAWYSNGSVMLIEEYEQDRLVKGLYMKKGEKSVVSSIENGEGIATLYDADGYFLKKIYYHKGIPSDHE